EGRRRLIISRIRSRSVRAGRVGRAIVGARGEHFGGLFNPDRDAVCFGGTIGNRREFGSEQRIEGGGAVGVLVHEHVVRGLRRRGLRAGDAAILALGFFRGLKHGQVSHCVSSGFG